MSRGNIASLLVLGTDELRRADIPEPRRESSSLLEFVLGRDRSFLIAHPDHEPYADEISRYHEFVRRRAEREPFHYITGVKEFYGLDFEVSPDVLIPRPETEMLVEQAIGSLSGMEKPLFCEVGVGSGCISIAVLAHVPQARSVGLEISGAAIEIALKNAETHRVASRFDLRRSDAFASLTEGERFDLVVSNPPYVPAEDLDGLQREVRDHEPREALTDGADGLAVIRRIVAEAPAFLKPGGSLMFEFGMGQAERILALFSPDVWRSVMVGNDLQHIPRTITAKVGK